MSSLKFIQNMIYFRFSFQGLFEFIPIVGVLRFRAETWTILVKNIELCHEAVDEPRFIRQFSRDEFPVDPTSATRTSFKFPKGFELDHRDAKKTSPKMPKQNLRCVSNATMVTSIQRMDPNRLRVGIRFNGFGDKVRISLKNRNRIQKVLKIEK